MFVVEGSEYIPQRIRELNDGTLTKVEISHSKTLPTVLAVLTGKTYGETQLAKGGAPASTLLEKPDDFLVRELPKSVSLVMGSMMSGGMESNEIMEQGSRLIDGTFTYCVLNIKQTAKIIKHFSPTVSETQDRTLGYLFVKEHLDALEALP